MAEKKKLDVYNRSSRGYTSPSGVQVPGGQTVQLDEDEALTMLKGYPRDLISPDTLRSSPASQGDAELKEEIERLQGVVAVLEAEKGVLETTVKELEAEVAKLSKVPAGK